MLNSEAWELLVQGYEAAHDAKGIAKAYSGRKWMVYRLAEQKRKTGGVRPGDIVAMDNMRSHHVKAVREILGAKGMKVLYLPPYSPDGSQELCANKLAHSDRTEVSQQRRRPQKRSPGASYSCTSCWPTGRQLHGGAWRRPASVQSCSSPPLWCGGKSPG